MSYETDKRGQAVRERNFTMATYWLLVEIEDARERRAKKAYRLSLTAATLLAVLLAINIFRFVR